MLVELAVHDLGVIADLTLLLGTGMTALTGETGAGKTLVVEAIELLLGARGDPVLVRPGADEARVEGRFVADDREVVLARVVPRTGRSRAYVDGRLAPVAALGEAGTGLVDLHGQHTHQSLLAPATQRAALDRFGAVDTAPLVAARARVREIDEALAALGGDTRARAREVDLLRHQLAEIERAAIAGGDEEAVLEAQEDELADATAHREAAAGTHAVLADDGGAIDGVAAAAAALAGRRPFATLEERLRGAAAELGDIAAELRDAGESIEDDPARLDAVRERRHLLRELRRKYGDTLDDVVIFARDASAQLAELESHDRRAAQLEAERTVAADAVRAAEAAVGHARRAAAPRLGEEIEAHLRELALPRARLEVTVGERDPGDEVTFLLGANPGEPALPLTKVASGGELARTMLAARLVLSDAPPTLVFDEVDAGIGGEAAVAVGRALAALGRERQVLVVTHLPQVAAFADHQIAVRKEELRGRTVASAQVVDGGDRVVELSRMLSGQPSSATARDHAEELLATAAAAKAAAR